MVLQTVIPLATLPLPHLQLHLLTHILRVARRLANKGVLLRILLHQLILLPLNPGPLRLLLVHIEILGIHHKVPVLALLARRVVAEAKVVRDVVQAKAAFRGDHVGKLEDLVPGRCRSFGFICTWLGLGIHLVFQVADHQVKHHKIKPIIIDASIANIVDPLKDRRRQFHRLRLIFPGISIAIKLLPLLLQRNLPTQYLVLLVQLANFVERSADADLLLFHILLNILHIFKGHCGRITCPLKLHLMLNYLFRVIYNLIRLTFLPHRLVRLWIIIRNDRIAISGLLSLSHGRLGLCSRIASVSGRHWLLLAFGDI